MERLLDCGVNLAKIGRDTPTGGRLCPGRAGRQAAAATIKKEVVSLRTAWNWARLHLGLAPEFPGTGLDYAKTGGALPFMSWEGTERLAAGGGRPGRGLGVRIPAAGRGGRSAGVGEEAPGQPVGVPDVCFAAHTGARRIEVARATPADLDLAGGVVTLREKKRDKERLTTRQVPLTPHLKGVLAGWASARGPGATLFCKSDGKPVVPRETHNYFRRTLRGVEVGRAERVARVPPLVRLGAGEPGPWTSG
jgi:integrase